MSIAALLLISKKVETTPMMDKQNAVNPYNETLFGNKKK